MKPIVVHPIQFFPGKKAELKNPEMYRIQTENLLGLYQLGIWKTEHIRSLSANKHYWGFCIGDPMTHGTPCNILGMFPEDLHMQYKIMFNNGESTTKLSKSGFRKYVEIIQIYMAKNFQIIIPDPNQVIFL
jgi:hypothetical protein